MCANERTCYVRIHTTSRDTITTREKERTRAAKNESLYHGLIVWLNCFCVLYCTVLCCARFCPFRFDRVHWNRVSAHWKHWVCANHTFSQIHSWNVWISWHGTLYGCLFSIFYRCCRLFSRLNSHKFKANRIWVERKRACISAYNRMERRRHDRGRRGNGMRGLIGSATDCFQVKILFSGCKWFDLIVYFECLLFWILLPQ